MEFTTTKQKYRVADIYDMFYGRLPVVVMVTDGFCGDIADDTFDREQVIMINAVSRQKRVVGRFSVDKRSKLISIPQNYSERLCVLKNKKARKEEHLERILETNVLPVLVQFPSGKVLTMGNRSIGTDRIPPIQLLRRFDEVYLLGHTIINEEVSDNIIHVPLYLSELRLSPVTGAIGMSPERWKLFLIHLRRKCSSVIYDHEFGNPDIAEYDHNADHNETRFSYVQPKSYSSIVGIVQGQPIKHRPQLALQTRTTDHPKVSGGKSHFQTRDQRPLPPLPSAPKADHHSRVNQESTYDQSQTENMYLTPLAASKSDHFESTDTGPVTKQFPPETPSSVSEREVISSVDQKHRFEKNPKYRNLLPRALISPQKRHIENPHQTRVPSRTQNPTFNTDSRTGVGGSENIVKELSVSEVCAYLEILNLGDYAASFSRNLIDGEMLVLLTESILREDFGMKAVESIRLLKFAKEGYIPLYKKPGPN